MATAVGFLVQIFGLSIAGTIFKFGLSPALVFQAICFGLGAFAIRRLLPQPPVIQKKESPFKNLADAFRKIYKQRDIMQTLIINCTSSAFNTGATISNLLIVRVMPLVRPGVFF